MPISSASLICLYASLQISSYLTSALNPKIKLPLDWLESESESGEPPSESESGEPPSEAESGEPPSFFRHELRAERVLPPDKLFHHVPRDVEVLASLRVKRQRRHLRRKFCRCNLSTFFLWKNRRVVYFLRNGLSFQSLRFWDLKTDPSGWGCSGKHLHQFC